MLPKMYLVSPEYVSQHPPPPTPSPHQPMASMAKARTKNSNLHRRRETKKKHHPHDKWVKLKRKIQDADFARKTLIENIVTFLQSILPSGSTSAGQAMPPPATPDVQAALMSTAPDNASPSLPFQSHAHESVFASPIKRSL